METGFTNRVAYHGLAARYREGISSQKVAHPGSALELSDNFLVLCNEKIP